MKSYFIILVIIITGCSISSKEESKEAELVNKGIEQYYDGNYQKAIQKLRQIPDSSLFYLKAKRFELASLFQIENYEAVANQANFFKFIEEDYYDTINLIIGKAYEKLNKRADAIKHQETAIKLNPNFKEAHINIAISQYNLGVDKKVDGYFESAYRHLTIAEGLSDTFDNQINTLKGVVLYGLEDYKGALTVFSNTVIESKDSVAISRAYRFKGLSLKSLNQDQDLERILQLYDSAIMFDPEDPNIYVNRATVYKDLGDLVKACKDQRRAFKLGNEESIEFIKKYCQ